MKVSFLPLAEQELDEAFLWYEEQVVGLGNGFLDEFNQSIKRIVAFPALYEQIDNNLRRCLMNRFPYGIIYGIDGEQTIIVALAHLKRRPNYWSNRNIE
ncbi:MAG: type II toxin-antitoxin system RelE/ParE family toxin [Firmicutes bacterium]|nr:type II toxin-antitoxin system RelE/ParE family toxin [Bacillota bacterium]